MTRKCQIQQQIPRKCYDCDKATNCIFLQKIEEKPYDVSGIILDCKAFYTVFCELERRICGSFEYPDDMSEYHEQKDLENRPYLTPAMITNGVLAVELALKALIFKDNGEFDCVHDIKRLFNSLPQLDKDTLSRILKEKTHQNDETLQTNLEIIKDFFEKWRYFFQEESLGYSGFLPEFIHIVCEYAIGNGI